MAAALVEPRLAEPYFDLCLLVEKLRLDRRGVAVDDGQLRLGKPNRFSRWAGGCSLGDDQINLFAAHVHKEAVR